MSAIDEIKSVIVDRTSDVWAKSQRPLMLTDIAPQLKLRGIEYKQDIFPFNLKQFIINEVKDVKVVSHPSQKAKVGVIPATHEYEFSTEVGDGSLFKPLSLVTDRTPNLEYGRGRNTVNRFLDELAKLPQDEIEKVNIPVSVLIKMINNR